MPENHVMREAELESKVSHFILEQLAQWFQQLEVQRFRQPADIVVRLYSVSLFGLRTR
jgi:hypothetical protein